jgi:hypothetical protein
MGLIPIAVSDITHYFFEFLHLIAVLIEVICGVLLDFDSFGFSTCLGGEGVVSEAMSIELTACHMTVELIRHTFIMVKDHGVWAADGLCKPLSWQIGVVVLGVVANDMALNVVLNHGNFTEPTSCHPVGLIILDMIDSEVFFPGIDARKVGAQLLIARSLGCTVLVFSSHKLFVPASYTFAQVGVLYELCERIVELVSFLNRPIPLLYKFLDQRIILVCLLLG